MQECASNLIVLIVVIKLCLVCSCSQSEQAVRSFKNHRQERGVLFPSASTVGIFAAIAVPLDDRKNVFVSYNFEANYNSPSTAANYIPGPLTRLDISRSMDSSKEKKINETSKMKRSLVTRHNFYKTLEKKLTLAGFNGHDCLLRAICESSETPLGMHNGVFGDILHIILTPSTSEQEELSMDFYDAELHGTMGLCQYYSKRCPKSIFHFISILES